MKRFHVHVHVNDLAKSIEFHVFGAGSAPSGRMSNAELQIALSDICQS